MARPTAAPRVRLGAFAGAITWAIAALAQPQPSVDVRTWHPSIDPGASLVLEPVTTPGPGRWSVGVSAAYAQDPVVLRSGSPSAVASRPLAHAIGADLVAGIGLGDRAAVGLDLPVFMWQDGSSSLPSSVVQGGTVPASGLGDLGLIGKATIVNDDRQGVTSGFGLAAIGEVTVPTGNRQSFAGDGAVTASVEALAEYAVGFAAVRATLGYALRTQTRTWPDASLGGVTFGDSILWSAGLMLRPKAVLPSLDEDDRQIWELAAHGALPAGPVLPFGLGDPGASSLSPALLAADDRIALGHYRDTYLLVGAELGLDDAVGVPTVRGVVSVGWSPQNHDRDGDGVLDDADQCPDLPEDRDGIQDQDGCPEDDADGDGILDAQDACPLVAGVASSDPKKNGCPGPSSAAVTPAPAAAPIPAATP